MNGMTVATVSAKGSVTIPARLRRKFGLRAGDKVWLVDYGGVLTIFPALKNPIKDARGLLKRAGALTLALLEERAKERERDSKEEIQ